MIEMNETKQKQIRYKIYFKNLDDSLDLVLDASCSDLNDIFWYIRYYENEQPELLENGEYIAIIDNKELIRIGA